MIERPICGRRIVSQLKEVTMKRVARICGVLSVLFLGVCIVACAARSESSKERKDKDKGGEATPAEKTVEKGKSDKKKDG